MKLNFTLLIVALLISMQSFAQSIGGLAIGQPKKEVIKSYGQPDSIMKLSTGDASCFVYDFGPKTQVYVMIDKKTETVDRLIAVGSDDRRGIFESRLKIRLGDLDSKLVKSYGTGKLIKDGPSAYSRQYVNIKFSLAHENGNFIVNRIEVFKPIKVNKK
jgi:hypothetical protein